MSPAHNEILFNSVKKQAVIIGLYRYWWHRKFDDGKGITVFGMLNPSKADRNRDDPTSRRITDFARLWDSSAVVIVNLFAAIATDPDELSEFDNAVGPRNAEFIDYACDLLREHGGRFVVGWGAHNLARLQAPVFLKQLRKNKIEPWHLGLVKSGMPRHPLYAPQNTELEPYGR